MVKAQIHAGGRGKGKFKELGEDAKGGVRLAQSETVVPEISANKYALNVRFMLPETVARPRVAERDVAFELTFCSL